MKDKIVELLKPQVSVEAKVSVISLFIGKMLDRFDARVVGLEARQLEKGDKGEKGDRGEKGERGDQGIPGVPGQDGKDGKDGLDGKHGLRGEKGVSVEDVSVAADNHLVVKLSDGREIDAGDLELSIGKTKYIINTQLSNPIIGWRDIIGQIGTKTVGANEPVWALYRGSIYQYTFDTATAEVFCVYHIPHDYVLGSDMHIHMHWSQIVVDSGGPLGVPGNAEWKFDITYADGHGTAGGAADTFVAPITVTVVQQASTTQYGHMIAEVQFTNNGGTGGLIDSNSIQVDGLILVRAYRIKGNAADTLNQAPFGHTCDVHYLSNSIGTKNKSPDFYT